MGAAQRPSSEGRGGHALPVDEPAQSGKAFLFELLTETETERVHRLKSTPCPSLFVTSKLQSGYVTIGHDSKWKKNKAPLERGISPNAAVYYDVGRRILSYRC